jgi:hypothetical protein
VMKTRTVVWTNLCARDPLEVKGRGIRGVADKEAKTVHTINIISQRQYFVARFHVGNGFGLHSIRAFVLLLSAS